MKKSILIYIVLLLLTLTTYAQVQLDKKIQLTGSSGNAKIEGIDEIVNNKDAVNKIYVDTAIANRASSGGCGTSNLDFNLIASISTITIGKGTTNQDLQLFLTYISGNASKIQFEITGLPNGVIYDISSNGTVFPSSSRVYFISNSSVPAGTYPLVITAKCGIAPKSVNFTLIIDNSKRVFLSSTSTMGNFGGVSVADQTCQNLANSRGLGNTWKAWVADNSNPPASRFTQPSDPYRLLNGTIVAYSWSDLTDGVLNYGFTVDESGATVTTNLRVWSNVSISGNVLSSDNCSNWTSTSGTGRTGVADRWWNADWTADNSYGCSTLLRFYCFEQ